MATDTTRLDRGFTGNPKKQTKASGTGKDSSKIHTRVAGITGLGLGAAGTVVIGRIIDAAHPNTENGSENEAQVLEPAIKPSWAIGDINIAEGVNDNMTFGEAFASARAEVGPGGAFEWHGGVYGTYTADEWNNMSVAERAAYNDHFSWSHVNAASGNVATVQPIETSNEIEVVEVNPEHNPNHGYDAEDVLITNSEPEIEILGVVHDHETGANIGGLTVDGQDVYLVDVDGDLEFDIVASDINGNGQLDQGEIQDIHGQGLTVDHLGGFSDPNDAIQASDDYLANNDDYSAYQV